MKRSSAVVTTLVTAGLLQLPAVPAVAAPDKQTSGLAPAVTELAGYLGGLSSYGRLGEPLPLTGLPPGGATGVDLTSLYAGLAASVGAAETLEQLAANVSSYDPTSDGRTVTTTATALPPEELSTIHGLRIELTAERAVEAPLRVLRAAAGSTRKVDLRSAAAEPGVPITLTWRQVATLRYDTSNGATWVDVSSGTPLTLELTAATAPDPFAGAATKAAVGVATVNVTPGSSFALAQTLTTQIADDASYTGGGDGRLHFLEPTSSPDVVVPGELQLPKSENVRVLRTGSVSTALALTTPLYKAGTDPGAQVSVALTPLADAPVTFDVVTNTGYDVLAAFQNVTGAELLGGLGQLVAALTGVARHPSVDRPLPYLDGRFSDTAFIAGDLAQFVLDHTRKDLPSTPENEFGTADFETVDQMFTLLRNEVDRLQDDELSPSFDAASADRELTFRLHLVRDLPTAAVPLTESPYVLPDSEQKPEGVGRPNLGSSLRAVATSSTSAVSLTGLSAFTDRAASYTSQATARTGFSVDVVAGVVLRDGVPCTACDTDPNDGYTQTEDLRPSERWFLRTGGGDAAPELTLSTRITSPVATTTVGRAGFAEVEVKPGSSVEVTPGTNATAPTIAVQIAPPGSGDDPALRLADLLDELSGTSTSVVAATRSYGAKVQLVLDSFDAAVAPEARVSLLPGGPAHVTVNRPDATGDIAAGDVTLDAPAELLKTLDFNLGAADALAGRYLSVVDQVVQTAQTLTTALPDGLLREPLPLLKATPASLFNAYTELRAKVDAVRAGAMPPSLQAMDETLTLALRKAPGLESAKIKLSLVDFAPPTTGPPGKPNLITRLDVDGQRKVPVPLTFEAGDFDVAALSTDGELDVTVTTKADLGIPIPLSTNEPTELYVMDSSRFRMSASFESTNAQVSAAVGGLTARLGPGGHIKGGALVQALVEGADSSFASFGAIDPAKEKPLLLKDFLPKLKGALTPLSGGVTCAPGDPDGEGPNIAPKPVTGKIACASLPVFVNDLPVYKGVEKHDGTGSNYLTVHADDADPKWTLPTGLDASYVAAAALNFGPIKEGLAELGKVLSAGLNAVSFDGRLPLIGKNLQEAAKVAEGLNTVTALSTIQSLGKITQPKVQDVREQVLAPIAEQVATSGVLRDTRDPYNNDVGDAPSARDVRFDLECDGNPATQDDCADGAAASSIQGLQVQMVLGKGELEGTNPGCPEGEQRCSTAVPVDLGIPAIDLKVSSGSTIELDGAWQAEIGFGYDRKLGFYLLENPLPYTGLPDDKDLEAEVKAVLQAAPPSLSATARLGFLEVKVSDTIVGGSDSAPPAGYRKESTDVSNHPSSVRLEAGLNLQGPDKTKHDERISGSQFVTLLSNLGESLKLTAEGQVNIDLRLDVTANGIQSGLPSIGTDLLLDWTIAYDPSKPTALQAGVPALHFNNVAVDAGSILTGTLGSTLRDIRTYTEPVDPLREFLFAPIPVLSDLSTMFGGEALTPFSLIKLQNPDSQAVALLEDINTLLDLVAQFTATMDTTGSPKILIGSFQVSGAKALGSPQQGPAAASLIEGTPHLAEEEGDPTNAGGTTTRKGLMDDVLTFAAKKSPAIKEKINAAAGDPSPDFTFPIFEKPSCVFSMLLGANCVVAQWAPDDLSARFDVGADFGPFFGVLYVTLAGFAEVKANVIVGYDTQGLRSALGGGGAVGILDGLFVNDLHPTTGVDRPEVVLTGGISAGGKLSVVVAEAGVRGGITATLNADLRDGGPTRDPASIDGVIRVAEVAEAARVNILCLFDFSGALEAFLEVYANFGLCPACYEENFELARVKLLDFSGLTTECQPQVPVLATPEGSVLHLNIGDRALTHRLSFTKEIHEKYSLTQRPDGSVAVTAFGYTQEHTGITSVAFDAGGGSDSVTFAGSSADSVPENPTPEQAAASSYGDSGNDPVRWTLPVNGSLGGDDDVARTGDGNDTVSGGGGTDQIDLGGGVDRANGDAGNDQVLGGQGDDVLSGGENEDFVDGGPGKDELFGNGGNDRLLGGFDLKKGDGTVVADLGDTAVGGPGNDFLDLGSGDDTAYGDDTGDTTDGEGSAGGEDDIRLGAGDDKAWAGQGDDGTVDPDTCGDRVEGGEGVDEIHGQGGVDCLAGGNGDDSIDGGPGGDRIDGATGKDGLRGQDGSDDMQGGPGADTMDGGGDADVMVGGTEDDDMSGGTGIDDLRGGDGADWIAGDTAKVTYPGGRRALIVTDDDTTGDGDVVDGGNGDDLVRGQGGADRVNGGNGADDLSGNGGNDPMVGGDGADTLRGNAGSDVLSGGPLDDLVIGDADDDKVYGDGGADRLIGGSETTSASADAGDVLVGGVGADVLLGDNGTIGTDRTVALAPAGAAAGQAGSDTLTGDGDDDRLYGQDLDDKLYGGIDADQLTGGLGDDLLEGQDGPDHMLGDQGEFTQLSGAATWPGGSPRIAAALIDPDSGGIDTIRGRLADDWAYGGAGDDVISGGLGDDHLEGGGGQDTVDGLDPSTEGSLVTPGARTLLALAAVVGDDDDIIGGSSTLSDGRDVRADAGEKLLRGGPGHDVVTGDNADITRTVTPAGSWAQDPVMGGAARDVALGDLAKTVTELAAVSGGDEIRTGTGNDRAFGQGGDDLLRGGEGDDVLTGEQSADELYGEQGQDDLVGGGMTNGGVSGSGRPDQGDELTGGPDQDVLAGDNATIVRVVAEGGVGWARDGLGADWGNARTVELHDLRDSGPAAGTSGGDLLLGNGERDKLYGQGDGDTVKGGDGDDVAYGGQGSDLVEGGYGEDDLVGGSYVAGEPDGGDRLQAGGGADVLLGDNGEVFRGKLPDGVTPDRTTAALGVTTPRSLRFLDVGGADGTSGDDLLAAGEGVDVGYGQDGDDQLLGGTGEDQLEGMGGGDVVLGDSTTSLLAPESEAELTARGGLLPLPSPLPQGETAEPELSGAGGEAGQDDLVGGTTVAGSPDGGDLVAGEGAADFLLGDNGRLTRSLEAGAYAVMGEYDGAVRRQVERFDVAGADALSGPDVLLGGAGNDRAWGQDDADLLRGGTGDDDLLGELGVDRLEGEDGQDALVGDRGSVTDTEIRDSSRQFTVSIQGPTFLSYTGLRPGTLDRRISLTHDLDGSRLASPGTTDGDGDVLLGGADHDVISGAFGDDVAHGNSGGDWMFGDAGRDVMWGGLGSTSAGTPNARGTDDALVDYLFGGSSGDTADTADLLDYRPRPSDPLLWQQLTGVHDDDPLNPLSLSNNDHHHGIDWIFGASGRDVLQADVGKNGPDDGDRLIDWNGAYNLYTRCNASYGDDGDVRQHSPAMQDLLEKMVFGSGAGATLEQVRTAGTSGAHQLALETRDQQGKAFPTTPGNYEATSCQR